MKKWMLARYLIDAKKCVDSIMFISEHVKELSNLNLMEFVNSKLSGFYINVRIVYDNAFTEKARALLKKSDAVYRRTMYEANKNYAHKDAAYIPVEPACFSDLINPLTMRLIHCREICSEVLPENVTLDFVSHDPILFRLLHKITIEKEEELKKLFHPGYGKPIDGVSLKTVKVFHDTEQIKTIDSPRDYGTIIETGITQGETLQKMQDGIIRTNVLYDTDMWVYSDEKGSKEMKAFLESTGMGEFF